MDFNFFNACFNKTLNVIYYEFQFITDRNLFASMSAFNLYTCSTYTAATESADFGSNEKHLLNTLHSMIGFFVTVVISSLSIAVL